MKRGFTLIEVLLSLFFLTVLLPLILSILKIMSNVNPPKIAQRDVFSLQWRQWSIRNPIKTCNTNYLSTSEFEVFHDKDRLVKRPGYEILLFDVRSVHFNCNENKFEIEFYDEKVYKYNWK